MNNDIIPKKICMVYKNKVEILNNDRISKKEVGAKAYGLSAVPPAWTLPFFVISSEMYEMYKTCQSIEILEKVWHANITEAMHTMHFDLSQNIFLRSNMCVEDLAERGKFESYECAVKELFITIKKYFDSISSQQAIQIKVPLLIQQYSQAIGCGHVSNERRLSKEHRDWKGEIEQRNWDGTLVASDNTFSIPLRNWRRKIVIDEINTLPLNCSSLRNITQVLEAPCAWATTQSLRIHFEWIFDGKYLYIVQADQEQDYGIVPIMKTDSSYHSRKSSFLPQVLRVLSSEDENSYSHYSKIRNPLIYDSLGFKTAPIYILEDQNEIQGLSNGKISEKLLNDIDVLSAHPLVIRTDINTEDQALRQMLPRTDDIRNKTDAIMWLTCKSKELYDNSKGLPFIFIFHNFIPAFSSAFAYAEPNNRNVLIESLWGVPEGLYYYAHDKHIVDTKQQELIKVIDSEISVIQKRISPKNNFIFPDANGKWNCTLVSTDYIWKPAVPKEAWLNEIAISTRKIAEHVGASVSVMWFVGVNSKIYGCNVFPWHHEQFTYDSVPKQTNRKKNRNEASYTISYNTDIEKLRQIALSNNRENVKYLLFKPVEESMIRNKDLIEEVGNIANKINAVITLDGGVLSHAYYQLRRTGAAVEVSSNFGSTVSDTEHHKLVRDKIPEKIISGGEIAITKRLSDDELFEQLRIKLVEEAFEVLEAGNIDDLIQELADVLEVIDSIIDKKEIQKKSVDIAQARKKEKVGGFKDGIILHKTSLPVYKAINETDDLSPKKEDKTFAWSDKKEKTDYYEVIKRFRVPISLKQWDTQLAAKGMPKRPDIHVTLKGKRINANMQIEISISEGYEQLVLFDD